MYKKILSMKSLFESLRNYWSLKGVLEHFERLEYFCGKKEKTIDGTMEIFQKILKWDSNP